mgnify:FL=1
MNNSNAKFSAIGRGQSRKSAYDDAIRYATEYFEVTEEELFVIEEIGRRHVWIEHDPEDMRDGWYYSVNLMCRVRSPRKLPEPVAVFTPA